MVDYANCYEHSFRSGNSIERALERVSILNDLVAASLLDYFYEGDPSKGCFRYDLTAAYFDVRDVVKYEGIDYLKSVKRVAQNREVVYLPDPEYTLPRAPKVLRFHAALVGLQAILTSLYQEHQERYRMVRAADTANSRQAKRVKIGLPFVQHSVKFQ